MQLYPASDNGGGEGGPTGSFLQYFDAMGLRIRSAQLSAPQNGLLLKSPEQACTKSVGSKCLPPQVKEQGRERRNDEGIAPKTLLVDC